MGNIKVLTPLTSIVLELDAGAVIADVTITQSSDYLKPNLEAIGSPYTTTLDGTTLTIAPDLRWMSGIKVQATYGGVVSKYIVPSDPHVYSPEQRLYSLDLLQAEGNLPELQNLGLVTPAERSLLEALGPKLSGLLHEVSKCLVTEFIYNDTVPPVDCTQLKGFRRMQQLMYMMGAGTLVEDILLSPGPKREWFNQAYILSPVRDRIAAERYTLVSSKVDLLYNAMVQAKLNVGMVSSLDLQIADKKTLSPLVKGIATIFCGIRYTHDNPKFTH
jgi:hypothetical protein